MTRSKGQSRPALFSPTTTPPPSRGGVHEWYRACRDHVTKREVRESLTRIWETYGHLLPEAPEDFVAQFRSDFPQRSWELYVLGWLAGTGATIERSPREGPDFRAHHPGVGRFWVECVVPTAGREANRVWERSDDVTRWAGRPDEPLALRYTSVLQEKIRKVARYRTRNIVAPDEPVIVALNQGGIRDSHLHDVELPLAYKVLYGVGDPVIRVDPYAHTTSAETLPRMQLKTASGALVSSAIFSESASGVIAGVLLARLDVFNLFPEHPAKLRFAHNPCAQSKMPVGVLPLGGEVWVDGEMRLISVGDL